MNILHKRFCSALVILHIKLDNLRNLSSTSSIEIVHIYIKIRLALGSIHLPSNYFEKCLDCTVTSKNTERYLEPRQLRSTLRYIY